MFIFISGSKRLDGQGLRMWLKLSGYLLIKQFNTKKNKLGQEMRPQNWIGN